MMRWIDTILNRTTMYRLVYIVLLFLLAVATVFGFLGILPYNGFAVAGTALLLVGMCWLTNLIFAWAFDAPAHHDSAYITGLILALIITPFRTWTDVPLLLWAPVLAMACKYIPAFHRQHIFNPAALAVAITAVTLQKSASWWVGTLAMLPAVLIGGFLVVRKMRRWSVVTVFLVVAILVAEFFGMQYGVSLLTTLHRVLAGSPLLFFATIMLTEPLTMPPTRRLRILYATAVSVLFAPQLHLGSIYSTPELALLAGNALFFLFVRRQRYVLRLRQKQHVGASIVDFVFEGTVPAFTPGQYFEWTVPHDKPDARGQRRYFTVASSPTESDVRLGVKFYPQPSTYKQALLQLEPGQTIIASQQDGDFTLKSNAKKKYVFLAGGIGVTPFRSIIKYLLDTQRALPIIMLYASNGINDFVYHELFDQAELELGIKTVYVLTGSGSAPKSWKGKTGMVTSKLIEDLVPDFRERHFYLSGPQGMVLAYERMLGSMHIPRSAVMTDYFPGFA